MAVQICSGQTSYTNPNATLAVSADAVRVSNSTVRVTLHWSIYTAGSSYSGAQRYIHIVNSGGASLGRAYLRDQWSTYTTYSGDATIDISVGSGTSSLSIGCKVLTSSGGGGTTLTWDGNKNTNTGNPTVQYGTISFAGNMTTPVVNRAIATDWNGSTFAVMAYVTGTTTRVNCPTWTHAGGQDDIVWYEMGSGSWNRNGQAYNYAAIINRPTNHGNQYGTYYSHVYAYNGDINSMYAMNVYLTKTLAFNGNGGTNGTSKSLNVGAAYGSLPSSSRTGYTFDGWYTAASGGSKVSSSTTMTTDLMVQTVTLYAHWTANTYTLTYNANGGSVSPSSKTGKYNSAWGTLAVPTRAGYEFKGWFTSASGGTQVTATTKITGNLTVYAHWEAIEYTLTYNATGGTISTGSKTGLFGLPWGELEIPTRTGYDFIGWFTSASGGTQVTADTVVESDLMVYAQWSGKQYTVSFDSNMEDVANPSPISVTFGSAYGELPTLSKENFNFIGWFLDEVGNDSVSNSTIVNISNNHTLYAKWNTSALGFFNDVPFFSIYVGDKYITDIKKGNEEMY